MHRDVVGVNCQGKKPVDQNPVAFKRRFSCSSSKDDDSPNNIKRMSYGSNYSRHEEEEEAVECGGYQQTKTHFDQP